MKTSSQIRSTFLSFTCYLILTMPKDHFHVYLLYKKHFREWTLFAYLTLSLHSKEKLVGPALLEC